jgi:hypothetical protein
VWIRRYTVSETIYKLIINQIMKLFSFIALTSTITLLSACASTPMPDMRADGQPLKPNEKVGLLRVTTVSPGGITMAGPVYQTWATIESVNGVPVPKNKYASIQVEPNIPYVIRYKCGGTFAKNDTGGAEGQGEYRGSFPSVGRTYYADVSAWKTSQENFGHLGIRSKGGCKVNGFGTQGRG